MSRIVLVTGGARSGKSTFAQALLKEQKDVVYIATARIWDEEMQERVKLHQASRPREWKTFEGCNSLKGAVEAGYSHYLMDCITIFTSNVMFEVTEGMEYISYEAQDSVVNRAMGELEGLIHGVRDINGALVMVTNEVGWGIVPDNHISRVYRDMAGRINQKVAALSDEVYLVSCGLPLRLK